MPLSQPPELQRTEDAAGVPAAAAALPPPAAASGGRGHLVRTIVLGGVLGAIFLGLAFWGVPLDRLGDAFVQMRWTQIGPLTVLFVVQYLLRAWRQQALLRPLAPTTTFRANLAILTVGFFCVNAFPARLGEAVRPYLFYEREGVPLGAGFALVFVERLIDLTALLLILLGVAFWVHVPDNRIELAGRTVSMVELGRSVALAVLLPLLVGLAGLAFLGTTALRLGERMAAWLEARVRIPAVHRLTRFALHFAEAFLEGVRPLRNLRHLAWLGVLTAVLFVTMGAQMVVLARAFHLEDRIGFGAGLGVLTITMLGIALPAPPGFAGVFEAATRGGLALFGVRGDGFAGRALAYALVAHWWNFALLTAWAAYFLWRDRIGLGRLFRFARGARAAEV
jgi:uncharacterized protein (TIRG00374 family)